MMRLGRSAEICDPTDAFLQKRLRRCSLDVVYVASDGQLPRTEERVMATFRGVRSHARESILRLMVDVMALAVAAQKGCAVLNSASTVSKTVHAIQRNVPVWCGERA